MPTPQIPLGSLNRLVASVTFPQNTSLNVTPPYLGRRSIRFTPDMDMTTFINMLTGMVPSPEPYVGVTLTVNLNKALSLAATWQQQYLSNTVLGPCTVRPDVPGSAGGIQAFDLDNTAIMRMSDMGFDGEDAVIAFSVRGTMYINNVVWSA